MTTMNDIHTISPRRCRPRRRQARLRENDPLRDVQKHFPQAPELAPGALLYALHAADGTPIMLTTAASGDRKCWSNELDGAVLTLAVIPASERAGTHNTHQIGRCVMDPG